MLTPLIAYWNKNQVCQFANNAYFEWFGVDLRKSIGVLTLKDLLGPVYETNLPYINAVLRGEDQQFIRVLNTPEKGARIGLTHYTADSVNGEILGFYVHVSDVTKEKMLEKEKERIEDILHKSNEVARIGSWEVDLIKNEVYWSQITREIHEVGENYKPDFVTAVDFFKEGESRQKILEAFNNAVNLGITYDLELKLVTGKGTEIWVRAIGQPEFLGESCNRVYGVFQDIDRVKRAEEQKNLLMAITNEQNGRLKNFAHIVSHNLRSHSTNIYNLLELFTELNPNFKEDELVSMLTNAATTLKSTIENLNEVVSINTSSTQQLVIVDLRKSIDSALSNLSLLITEHNVSIRNFVDSSLFVMGVPAYIDSIILNFLSNAIKYRSPLRIPFIELKAIKSDGFVNFIISDNGLGIDLKRYGDKLFGMYKTFHKHPDSRGVGLFITKNQLEAIGGTVEVKSQVDIGTTFIIKLKADES